MALLDLAGGATLAESAERSGRLRFSLVASGAFYRALGRCHLSGPDQLPNWHSAFLLAAAAPFLVLVATRIPLPEMLQWPVGVIF
jgi:hypothetical protein